MSDLFSTMYPLETQEIIKDIFAVKNNYVNLFLIKSGGRYIAVDAGLDNEETESALKNLGIKSGDVAAVFLTHTDYDHVAAVSLFASAEIYMAESNRIFIEGKTGYNRSKDFMDMNREYKTLKDDEIKTAAGLDIRCIFTPGHVDGAACYVVNGKYLFTGDNLNLENGKAALFYTEFNMDDDVQRQSVQKLSRLDGIEGVFTMHTGYAADFKAVFADCTDL